MNNTALTTLWLVTSRVPIKNKEMVLTSVVIEFKSRPYNITNIYSIIDNLSII